MLSGIFCTYGLGLEHSCGLVADEDEEELHLCVDAVAEYGDGEVVLCRECADDIDSEGAVVLAGVGQAGECDCVVADVVVDVLEVDGVGVADAGGGEESAGVGDDELVWVRGRYRRRITCWGCSSAGSGRRLGGRRRGE